MPAFGSPTERSSRAPPLSTRPPPGRCSSRRRQAAATSLADAGREEPLAAEPMDDEVPSPVRRRSSREETVAILHLHAGFPVGKELPSTAAFRSVTSRSPFQPSSASYR